jgi:SAM-dependent methyltransferase
MADAALKQAFEHCPLCHAPVAQAAPCATGDCSAHPLYRPELPRVLHWLQCADCGHVFTADRWTEAGEALVFGAAHAYQLPAPQQAEQLRNLWAWPVHRVGERLCETRGRAALYGAPGAARPRWLDVGFGAGGLVMTAQEFGFAAIGVDVRAPAVRLLADFGYRALCAKFEDLALEERVAVLSLCDVLEHLADPVAGLAKAHALLEDDGLLYVSCPNSDTATWRQWEQARSNPYWGELEHYHNFSRDRLVALLRRAGFDTIDYYVSARYYSCMELIARRRSA